MKTLKRIQSEPQRRVDAIYRYIEAIENGEDTSAYISSEPPRKYYAQEETGNTLNKARPEQRYKRPLYVRDKHNPRILHPYRGRR